MKSGNKLFHHEKPPNQLKVVTKIPISKSTEAKGGRDKTSALYATSIAEGNYGKYINSLA